MTLSMMRQQIEQLESMLNDMKKDFDKFERGNNAAGVRVRKFGQGMKKLCQDIRVGVQEHKKNK